MKKRKSMPDSPPRPRLVPRRGGGVRVVALGRPRFGFHDLYARLLGASWWQLTLFIALLSFLTNVLFAYAYMVSGGIENARAGSFADAFFFSVQTMATIGYGKMTPVTLSANILVSLEALFGFGFFAVTTGLVFAKVSRPTARVLFSEVAVVTPYNGTPHVMIRLANQRNNRIVNPTVQLSLLSSEVSKEGHRMRRFHDLKLVRAQVPFLQLTWTVMHPIDAESPLFGLDIPALCAVDAEIILTLIGFDETFAQTVHSRHSYLADEIIWDAAFEDVLRRLDDGRTEINYHQFHQTKSLNRD